jgi:hypothetical protein
MERIALAGWRCKSRGPPCRGGPPCHRSPLSSRCLGHPGSHSRYAQALWGLVEARRAAGEVPGIPGRGRTASGR